MEPTVIEVSGERPYPVLVGRDLLGDLPPLLGSAAQAAVVFAGPVREHAAASGRTISWVVTQALEEFLSRGRREHPRK